MTPTPQTQSATRLNRLSAGATKHSAELQNLLLPNGTGPGSRTQGRTSTALTVATDDRPETTAGSKLSPARHPVPGDGRGPKLQTAGFMAVPFFNVVIIHLRVLPAPPDLFPPFTPAGKIQPQSQSLRSDAGTGRLAERLLLGRRIRRLHPQPNPLSREGRRRIIEAGSP